MGVTISKSGVCGKCRKPLIIAVFKDAMKNVLDYAQELIRTGEKKRARRMLDHFIGIASDGDGRVRELEEMIDEL